ncbi:protein MIZU-KUSSEI 1 [Andrographis paniculata]|uniref:protein MIZU-KUSSEI 1 n=1 Tax=Andrographis paniculata TaxID=175694 RepID=UPI0021E8790F|nr:protein MIZU-KUSSEI 1 [Andrographis paniculata]
MPTPKHRPSAAHPPPSAVAPDQSPARTPTPVSLQKPSPKKPVSGPTKLFRRVKSVFRSFPVITTPCRMPSPAVGGGGVQIHGGGSKQVTGTLFGHRKSRVNLAIQDHPRCLPLVVLELSIQTGKLLQDMGAGLVRIALECEKNPRPSDHQRVKLMDEPIWSMYCNGRKAGYAVRREATDDDLNVMQLLHAASMGAGVLPETAAGGGAGGEEEGEMTYMRANFERVVGSKDSETYYMVSPDGNTGPELSVFFVRV